MNLGAAMAAGGVALSGLNDYRRQAANDEYEKSRRDLALEQGKLNLEITKDQVSEVRKKRTQEEIDAEAEAAWIAAAGDAMIAGQPGGVPPGGGEATMRLPDTAGAAPTPVQLPDNGTPGQVAPLIAANGVAPAAPAGPAPAGPAAGVAPAAALAAPGTAAAVPAAPAQARQFDLMYRIGREKGSVKLQKQAIAGLAAAAAAQYTQALTGAAAALAGGDAKPMVTLYNQRFPNGHQVADIEPLPDGGVIIREYDPRGRAHKLRERVLTPRQVHEQMVAMQDPGVWVKMVEERYKQQDQLDRELTVKKEDTRGALEVATVKEAGADRRSQAEIEGREKTTRMSSGATIRAAQIGLEGVKYKADNPTAKPGDDDAKVVKAEGIIRYSLTGSNTMATMDPATQAVFDRAVKQAGEKIRAGADFEAAATEALADARKAVKLDKLAPAPRAAWPVVLW